MESYRKGYKETVTVLEGKHGVKETGETGVWREWIEPVSTELWSQALGPGLRAHATAEYGDGAIAAVRYQNTHYLGFWPTRELLLGYIQGVCSARGVPVERMPPCLRVSRHDGVSVAVNYGGEPQWAPAPRDSEFVFGGQQTPHQGPGGRSSAIYGPGSVAAHGVLVWIEPPAPGAASGMGCKG